MGETKFKIQKNSKEIQDIDALASSCVECCRIDKEINVHFMIFGVLCCFVCTLANT